MKLSHGEAVVLKKKPLKEKDELIVLLTKHHGKMALYSYGSRDPKSRKSGVLELFNSIFFNARSSKASLPVLQQAKLLKSRGFEIVGNDESLERFYIASEMVRITDAYLQESQIVRSVFDDLDDSLDEIEIPFVGQVYKIRFLTNLGFLPDFRICTVCHEGLKLQEELVFDHEHNGFAHRKCSPHRKSVFCDLVKVMSFFQKASFKKSMCVQVSSVLIHDIQECLDQIRVEEDI